MRMDKKSRNIWIIIVLLLITGLLLVIFTVNSSFEYNKLIDEEESWSVQGKYIDYLNLNLNINILIWTTEILLIFLLVIGAYIPKKLTWVGIFMFGFFEIFTSITLIVNYVSNYYIVNYSNYPQFNLLNLVIGFFIIVLFSIVFYLLFKSDVKSYFKITY